MTTLRLGVIGMSEGNGHPYSWSAIFNGYEPAVMEQCGFPTIPRYLEKRSFPEDCVHGAHVTHVWAQDPVRARHIAAATHIEHVVDNFEAMIGQVDGLLLARDDAENHPRFAGPFLDAGLPVYIDKPLAISVQNGEALLARQRYPGQLFSCSALRYATEFRLDGEARAQVGAIRYLSGTVPNSWAKYAVHGIEPMLLLVPDRGAVTRVERHSTGNATTVHASFESGLEAQISAISGAATPLGIRVIGDRDWRDLIFKDTFAAFRAALEDFINGVRQRDVRIAPEFMLEVVRLIEAGVAP